MSLRPRYSLLTLLLLMAGIALGVKLWRGPHRVVLPNWSSDEWRDGVEIRALWTELKLLHTPILMLGTDVNQECEYVQEPRGKRVLTVSETWRDPRYLIQYEATGEQINPELNFVRGRALQAGQKMNPEIRVSETPLTWDDAAVLVQAGRRHRLRLVAVEEIRCWVGSDPTHYPFQGGRHHHETANRSQVTISYAIPDDQWHPYYFLTAKGELYQLRTWPRTAELPGVPVYTLEKVEWSALTDASVKNRLQEYWQSDQSR